VRSSPQDTAKAYLTLIPSIPAKPDGRLLSGVRPDARELQVAVSPIQDLHKKLKISSLRVARLSKMLSRQTSPSQLGIDRQISDEMQKTVQIERRISDQAGSVEDAKFKLEIALSYSDDAEIAWRLVRSAFQDLCRK
jgi:hypothetical protein